MNLTVGKLAEYILKNRNAYAFKNCTLPEIAAGIEEDIKNNSILYVVDADGTFAGVISFKIDVPYKCVFVRNILVTKHAALVVFVQYFQITYPGYTLAGTRYDEYIHYNTHRLCHLLKTLNIKR